MTLILNGTSGLSDVDGSAATPAIRGTDANTGIFFPAADTIGFAEGGTEAMRIDSSGNVGIGTSSPAARLDTEVSSGNTIARFRNTVSGSGLGEVILAAPNRPAVRFNFQTSNDSNGFINYDTGEFKFFNNSSGSATERMRIDTSGNLLVGTTSGVTSGGFQFNVGGVSYLDTGHITGTATGNGYSIFRYNGTVIGRIDQNGTTAVSYTTTSDYRLKDNIMPLTGALARVAALKPCTYTWKAAPDETGEGFIAHELAEVCPQATTGEKDAVDADGNPQYQGIDTSFLIATLTAAIQEQQALITKLQADVAALKAQP